MNEAPPLAYRLIVLAFAPLFLAYTVWRSVKDGGWIYLKQRLGFSYPSETQTADLWVHAASVGEVTTVLPLLELALASSDHSIESILLTTNTPTAKQVLKKHDVAAITHAYLPIDFAFACSRFCSRLRTRQGWIVETEIWPRLYTTCRQHQISLTIINGRLSDKTLKYAAGILRSSYEQAMTDVQVLARSPEDNSRFVSIGAEPTKVKAVGNLKYMDSRKPVDVKQLLNRDYIVAASTHDNEEVQLAREWIKQDRLPLLVIVPRHPERASVILQSLQKETGLAIKQRSAGEEPQPEDQLYLADTLGELQAWYHGAQATFVGGSLIERGGHNMLEPARMGVPAIVGPHTHNFTDIMQLMIEKNAISIADDAQALTMMLVSAARSQAPYSERAQNAVMLAESFNQVGSLYLAELAHRSSVKPSLT